MIGQKEATIAVIIPARYGACRFPGKPLVKIAGISMIERVVRQAEKSSLAHRIIVATEDERVSSSVRAFGGECVLTSAHHPTGTDRLAEVVQTLPDVDIVVNVQGDNPLIDPGAIDIALRPLLDDRKLDMSTVSWTIASQEEVESSQIVKVVVDNDDFALYFSRSPIPFYRDDLPFKARKYRGHIGLYVYRRHCLLKIATLPPSTLEQIESLEQLRALTHGIKIKVVEYGSPSPSVDVPEDIAKIETILTSGSLQHK